MRLATSSVSAIRPSAVRSARNLIALTCALAAASMAATALPGTSRAAQTKTVAQAQALVSQLNDQAEQLTEQYNAAQADLAKATTVADAAKKRASQAADQLKAARSQVATFAVERYEAGGESQTMQSVVDGDPQLVADRIATLALIGRTQSAAVTRAHAADLSLRAQLTAANQATATAAAIRAKLDQQRQHINAVLAQANQVLNQLSAQQRAQLLAAQQAAQSRAAAVAAPRASRSNVRAAVPVAAPAPPQSSGGSSVAQRAVAAAMSKLGRPYVWGAAGPNYFDCSGLVQWSYRQAGIATAHYTGAFWAAYRHVNYNDLQPGDLVFFYADHHHVGIYIGGGMMVDAPQTGDVVKVQSVMGHGHYSGAVRVVG